MIGLFCMVRKPFNLKTWIDYHLSIGIDFIFLRVEDTPELKELLDQYSNIIVEWVDDSSKYNNYWTLIDRQKNYFDSLINKFNKYSLDWVFHVDSDELICVNNIKSLLSEIPSKYSVVHLYNYEAVYDRDDLENPFLQTNKFKVKKFLSYVNGKCAARVKDIEWLGPHRFSGQMTSVSVNKAVILHFESPTFDIWYEKFKNSSNNDKIKESEIPMGFYRDSIRIVRENNIQIARDFYNNKKININDGVVKLFWTPLLDEKNIVWSR